MTENNIVYIGSKPLMSYVMAVITAFNATGGGDVVLKARGRAISSAVDVAEITRNRYMKDIRTGRIEIGSEQLPSRDGGTRGVSTIAIILEKVSQTREPEAETLKEEEEKVEATPEKPLDVSEIKGVGRATEEKLTKAGFTTVKSVATTEAKELSEKTGISEKVAAKLIESAKELQK